MDTELKNKVLNGINLLSNMKSLYQKADVIQQQ